MADMTHNEAEMEQPVEGGKITCTIHVTGRPKAQLVLDAQAKIADVLEASGLDAAEVKVYQDNEEVTPQAAVTPDSTIVASRPVRNG